MPPGTAPPPAASPVRPPAVTRPATPVTVLAIGGNALLNGGPRATIAEQFAAARQLARPVAELVRAGHRVVVTHGNGPQVGFIKRRADLAAELAPELPLLDLDMCVADSQGSIGYILVRGLSDALPAGSRPVALLTHTVVDPADPAFARPTKPIGTHYERAEAERLAARHGWTVADDAGRGWRRVVPSPAPHAIVELDAVAALLDAGHVVVAGGGGGIPVTRGPDGALCGVEAVVDKDATSALLASALGADELIVTTGVERIALDWGTPRHRDLDRMDAAQAHRYLAEGQFPEGSMGPKVRSALDFLASGGHRVLITSPGALSEALRGATGTRIVPTARTVRSVNGEGSGIGSDFGNGNTTASGP
ncbi:carbamate kinase [Streptomyces sp. NBC_00006]|uniref:carbamate kinase n=1 Tax=Streptomyces sp. NBC_00006 TaxID=2975619 RepID=UPI002255F7DE|nr:carbamate kinase [Streptomyces sp. NBC_00006]MCX5536570.1 carbamate kinase [Streptomyces sp. NBC_00006]